MNYRVVYTQGVASDLADKVDYLREQGAGEQTISEWFNGLYDRIEYLSEMPRAYGVDPYASEQHGYLIRKLTYKQHIIRYRVDEKERVVHVVSFIHGAGRADT